MKKSVIFTPAFPAILLLLITSQAEADQGQVLIDVQHDSKRQVTCWITPQGGISCLPDHQLGSLPKVNVTPSHIEAEPTPAAGSAPLPQVERFQL